MKAHQLKARRDRTSTVPPRLEWIWGVEALERSAESLAKLPAPFLLVGEAKLLSPWRKRISGAWIEAGLEILPLSFPEGSECCEEQAKAIAAVAKAKKAGTLIAWGGGKCLDSVKWAGLISKLPVVTVPSSAATCAAATNVVVAHSAEGRVLDIIDLESPPAICVADFELLKSAPERTLKAGLADTAAKWLEWKAVEEPQGPGADAAQRAYGIVMEAGSPNELLWEANLKLSAQASVEGGAPAAWAHDYCAAASKNPESRAWLHGEWVGLGLLFQAEKLGQDAAPLKAWLASNGLPLIAPFHVDLSALSE